MKKQPQCYWGDSLVISLYLPRILEEDFKSGCRVIHCIILSHVCRVLYKYKSFQGARLSCKRDTKKSFEPGGQSLYFILFYFWKKEKVTSFDVTQPAWTQSWWQFVKELYCSGINHRLKTFPLPCWCQQPLDLSARRERRPHKEWRRTQEC